MQIPNHVFGYGRLDVSAAYLLADRPPFPSNQTAIVAGDVSSSILLRGSDPEGQPLGFEIVSIPAHGIVSALNPTTGSIRYTPVHAFSGDDSFSFRTHDGRWASGNAVVTLVVSAPIDTDHDGIPNYWELLYGLNPSVAMDATADPDQDGFSNYEEYLAHTHPRQRDPAFRIAQAVRAPDGSNLIVWNSVGGTRYRVQYSEGGAGGPFVFHDVVLPVDWETDPAPVGGVSSMAFTDDFTRTGPLPPNGRRYYRIRLLQE